MIIKAGVSYYFMKDLLAALDFNYSNSNYGIGVGGDYNIMKTGLTARLGGEYGSLSFMSINCGLGYEFEQTSMGMLVSIDYGFKFPLNFIDNLGTHIVSITLRDIPKKILESELR